MEKMGIHEHQSGCSRSIRISVHDHQNTHLPIKSSNVTTRFDESCLYLLENTFTKLAYLKVLQSDPLRELNAVLSEDDIAQIGLSLDGKEGNPQAVKELQQFINLKASSNDRILVSDIVDRFSKRPFGWPDNEVLLIIARLAVGNQLTFQLNGGTLSNKEAFAPLSNTRKRREVAIIKKRQPDEGILKQARNLSQNLFSSMGPAGEKELFESYTAHFNEWLSNLKSYKSKTDLGGFPGGKSIAEGMLVLQRLLGNDDSFDFFKQIVANKNDYLDLEEEYRDVYGFFNNQLTIWQQLKTAIINFDKNKQALDKDPKAATALAELRSIQTNEAPYNVLNKVSGLITAVSQVNNTLVTNARNHGMERVDQKIALVQEELEKSGLANGELSNKLLRPLQIIKQGLTTEVSIPQIHMLHSTTADDCVNDALDQLNKAVEVEMAKREAALKQPEPAAVDAGNSGNEGGTDTATISVKKVTKPAPAPLVKPKPVVEVSISDVLSQVSKRVYIENAEDAKAFIDALEEKLSAAIDSDKRVRIR